MYSSEAPSGYTGATGSNCSVCHSGSTVNNNGSITATGLPTAYTPGATYNFSVTIASGQASRSRWGFALKAVDAMGVTIGTFNVLNSNANLSVGDDEIRHGMNGAVSVAGVSYTYPDMSWVAPSTASGPITFYMVGNAANGSGTSGDYIYTSTIAATVLPIELLDFQGKNAQNGIALRWQTATETNNSHFIVERSDDGKRFEALDKIAGKNTTMTVQNYSFLDEKPLKGSNYYRLKQVDNDGKSSLSRIISIKSQNDAAFVVFPNPTKDVVTVRLSEDETLSKIQLIGIQGNIILETTQNTISLRNQPKGNYIIRAMNSEGQMYSKSVVLD
jgi:hypothetical protein